MRGICVGISITIQPEVSSEEKIGTSTVLTYQITVPQLSSNMSTTNSQSTSMMSHLVKSPQSSCGKKCKLRGAVERIFVASVS